MKEKFINFLKKKRLYKRFMKNMEPEIIEEVISRTEYANKKGINSTPIQAAFLWGKTEEGTEFWGQVNSDWIKESIN